MIIKFWGYENMRKVLLISVFVTIMLCACDKKDESLTGSNISVSFTSQIESADIWIIPNTEENRKTTNWGKATIPKAIAGGEYSVSLPDIESHEYLLRMIDDDHMYYESGYFWLLNGYTMEITGGDDVFMLVIHSPDGKTTTKNSVFKSSL